VFPSSTFSNAYVQLSVLVPYAPQDLTGKTWSEITAAITGGQASTLGTEIDASADYFTAAIRTLTGNRPANACTAAVRALQPAPGVRAGKRVNELLLCSYCSLLWRKVMNFHG
jgi:hypothetical protein